MSDSPIRVLIIEDEPFVVETLKKAFERSRERAYTVAAIDHPSQLLRCNDTIPHGWLFDVAIVDLGFRREGVGLTSIPRIPEAILLSRHRLKASGISVVYSAFTDPEIIVDAMRYGPVDYFSKSQVAPHELPRLIHKVLSERERQAMDSMQVIEWLETLPTDMRTQIQQMAVADGAFLANSMSGSIEPENNSPPRDWWLAIIVETNHNRERNQEVKIVAVGSTQLEALLLYTHKRLEAGERGQAWPREPFLHSMRAERVSND
jgi:DNA-binding NarL/FixJ family response regulator